jgi:hypothetical protein
MTKLDHRITSDGPLPPCDDCGVTFLGPPIGECPARLRAALDEANAEVVRLRAELAAERARPRPKARWRLIDETSHSGCKEEVPHE